MKTLKIQKVKRLSPCHGEKLVRRKTGAKNYVCPTCGYACGSDRFEQIPLDMK